MSLTILDYDHDRDWAAVKRIYFEVGWLDDEDEAAHFEHVAKRFDGIVMPLDGEAECAVFTAPGAMQHLDTDVRMTAVAGVTTSRVARKLGAAQRLTAESLARGAESGSELATLGMFDQGFYNRIGFGNGSYENQVRFDPATLTVDVPFRPPKRITPGHWADVHKAMHSRLRAHGGCLLDLPEIAQFDMASIGPKNFGLGYFDGPDGALSHFIWGQAESEHGPYRIDYYAYANTDQLFELLALIRSLGDQVSLFSMIEPAEVQFQDLIRQPFRNRENTRGSKYEQSHRTVAYWQARMLDVGKCLAKTRLDAEPLRFNLALSDPISGNLDPASNGWRGCAGDYVVTVGPESSAETGTASGLPVLHASVGAFTRLWLGVRNATSLSLTDDMQGDPQLLQSLDRVFRLPQPHFGWDF